MLIKSWLKGPWWKDGIRHEGQVNEKLLPTDNSKHTGIIGIVDCVIGSSVGQGFTSRGIPLYLCYPLRQDYPPFLVAVKEKYSVPPIVSMNMEHWDTKWPRGGIQRVLGSVGDATIETEALIKSLQLPRSAEVYDTKPDLIGYQTTPWDFVCNIDPEGCKDVDDILCWRTLDNGSVEFAISIADVSSFIAEGSVLDLEAKLRGSTLYDNGHAKDPMLPTYVSQGCASLLADGVARPSIALIYTLFAGDVVSVRWERIVCSVNQSYTYDTVMKSPHTVFIRKSISSILGYDVGNDSHLWIEAIMVLYNTTVAELLRDKRVGCLRVHEGTQLNEWVNLAKTTKCPELAFMGSSGGRYVDGNTTDATRHVGLGKSVYCHASSPLRRYADLINQRWLKHILFGYSEPLDTLSVDLLNNRCSALKSCEHLLWFLNNIDVKGITTVSGFVVEVGKKVYVPQLRRCLRGVMTDEFVVSQKVSCRIFCDMNTCNLAERYVVQISRP
jgi:exoribonuclease R